jgi:DNA-binding response OmpR family regulator
MTAKMIARRSVLVVEDDPVLQRAMAVALEGEGYEVLTALDYATAVRILATRAPTLVCVDLSLPRESGLELCEHMRKQASLLHVPILITSDRSFPEDMAHAEEAGANAFLKKPFTMKSLLKYITALLDGPRSSQRGMRRLRLM